MKKKLSWLLAAASLAASFSAFPMSASAASFSDVAEDNIYRKAIVTLNKLNVINGYSDGTFKPDNEITRAEFTKLVVYMLGQENMSTKITQFKDVDENHWANENICAAFNLGIINGFSDTEFGPDQPVTYEQALKMVVCALGYQNDAEAKGGYPEGYRTEAVTLGLNKDIDGIAYTANCPRGAVAQIMYNALEIDLREMDGSGKWAKTDKTLLNDYLDTYILKGTVVGVEKSITANCDAGELNPGFFAIDDEKTGEEYIIDFTEYTAAVSDMTQHLGKTIRIYYRTDDLSDDKWLIEVDSETSTNKEITVSSLDLHSYDNYTLKYYPENSGRAESVKLDSADLTIRYNGKVVDKPVLLSDGNEYAPEDALVKWLDTGSSGSDTIYGTVRLIDSGSSGKYNIIDIYDYENIVANAAPVSPDYRITDKSKTGNFLTLNPDDTDYRITLNKNGSAAEVTSIAANDVISYAKSLDGDLYTVNVSSEKVTGKITNLNLSDKNPTISIDSKEYHVTQRFIDYIAEKDKSTLETGSTITAYTDAIGSFEWGTISKTTTFYPYAYVINVVPDGEDYYIKMFAPTSPTVTSFSSSTAYKVKSFKIQSDKPKLNDKKSTPEAIESALAAAAELPDENIPNITGVVGTGYNQLIKVKFNEAGEVSEVITMSGEEGSQNEDNSKLVKYKGMDPDNKYYIAQSSIKESSSGTTYYSVRSNTPLFVIPKDRTDDKAYALKSAVTTTTMTNGSKHYVDAYDLSTTKYPKAMVVYTTTFKTGTPITYSTAYRLMAKDIEEEYDETEGDIFSILNTYTSATTVTKTKIAPEYVSAFSRFGKGDVFLNGLDSDKYADTFMPVIDYDEVLSVLSGTTYDWTEEREAQDAEHYYQKYKFDFRYPSSDVIRAVANDDEPENLKTYWQTGGNVTNISSRAFMVNVMQVLTEDNQLYVTRDGFDENGVLNDSNYVEIKVNSSTKILRYDADEKEFTPYAQGTESTALTIQDLKDAENYGNLCSKVLITYVSGSTTSSSATPTAKFIVIYE